ncbi:DUF5667 domain-containing protein [Paenibacillus harenae]|uniref:DUF5667 domain-containing protein n=1 Tax=Paenibacillus harenae TaxID=306543 RepID=A0ABT9U939_PAEHA|nr:DUF5667 domain-containing protein [Paenibacillus harenae]MDQ0116166.1 hypothetical protein [Paenibacillus harenae]
MHSTKDIKGFIAKSTIISMLAFSVGTGSAWADEAGSQSTITADDAATTSSPENAQEAPSLLPGDFFYFVKTIYERIQLAFASDNMEEAILLAQFAQERLAESAVLLEEGHAEIAGETLQRSLSQQQKAIDTAASVIDPVATYEHAESTDPSAEERAVESKVVNTTSDDEDQLSEDANEEEEGVEPAKADKVKNSLQHNIVALAAALDKVSNPKAQSSLLKNITKSFAHLEKKLTKLSGKSEEEDTTSKTELTAQAAASTTTTAVSSQRSEQDASSATAGSVSTNSVVEDNKSAKPLQEDKQKRKKEKEQQQASKKQLNKPTKSHENAGKSESARQNHKKETK